MVNVGKMPSSCTVQGTPEFASYCAPFRCRHVCFSYFLNFILTGIAGVAIGDSTVITKSPNE